MDCLWEGSIFEESEVRYSQCSVEGNFMKIFAWPANSSNGTLFLLAGRQATSSLQCSRLCRCVQQLILDGRTDRGKITIQIMYVHTHQKVLLLCLTSTSVRSSNTDAYDYSAAQVLKEMECNYGIDF